MDMCEDHPDRPSVIGIIGERDSFGTEYVYLCEPCFQEHVATEEKYYAIKRRCDRCSSLAILSCFSDPEDHDICSDICNKCRDKINRETEEELAYYRRLDDEEYHDLDL